MNIGDIIGIIQVLEFPLTIFGGYILYKKMMQNKEVQDIIQIFREGKDTLKKLLDEYNKANGR
jgi:hypothetical protein